MYNVIHKLTPSTAYPAKTPPKPPPTKRMSNDDSDDDFLPFTPTSTPTRARGTNVQCHSQTNTFHSLYSQTKAQAGRQPRRRSRLHNPHQTFIKSNLYVMLPTYIPQPNSFQQKHLKKQHLPQSAKQTKTIMLVATHNKD